MAALILNKHNKPLVINDTEGNDKLKTNARKIIHKTTALDNVVKYVKGGTNDNN